MAGKSAAAKDDLDTNYARAGYHARQKWGSRPAIVMIDFANAYFDPASPLYGGEGCRTALDNAIKLAAAARAAGVPVIFTEVKYQAGGADGGAFYAKVPALSCFDAGKDTQKLAEGLTVEPQDVLITKQYPSAFFGTSLDSMLRHMKVDTLLLAGVTTSGCVRATCIDSISYGFVTLVISDAVGDRAPEPHAANLYDMSAKYADLLSTGEAIEYMKAVQQTATGRTQS
jgi:maleamate amidohydrolase